MRFYVAWLNDVGGLNGPADWNSYFDDYVPLVGEYVLVHWYDDDVVQADKVVERYVTYDPDDVPVWLIVLQHSTIPADRADFARRVNRDFAKREADANAALDATIRALQKSPLKR